jgi:hypothetical protein
MNLENTFTLSHINSNKKGHNHPFHSFKQLLLEHTKLRLWMAGNYPQNSFSYPQSQSHFVSHLLLILIFNPLPIRFALFLFLPLAELNNREIMEMGKE